MDLSSQIKQTVSLVEMAGKIVQFDQQKSDPQKGEYWALCPFHAENTPSFMIRERPGNAGKFRCYGCNVSGSVIDFVMLLEGVTAKGAIQNIARSNNIRGNSEQLRKLRKKSVNHQRRLIEARKQKANRALEYARKIWRESIPAHSALVEYLEGRGICVTALGGVPASLRYHPNLSYRKGKDIAHKGGAMISCIGRKRFLGIHRTWIDGPARARLPHGDKVPKMLLGQTGAIFGQPIKLSPPAPRLIVGEGIETTLAVFAALHKAGITDYSAEAAITLGALSGPEDITRRCGKIGKDAKPLPSPFPAFGPSLGWLPPEEKAKLTIILPDPSTKCPTRARLNAERAFAKISAYSPARLLVPLGHFAHDNDFADLAARGVPIITPSTREIFNE